MNVWACTSEMKNKRDPQRIVCTVRRGMELVARHEAKKNSV